MFLIYTADVVYDPDIVESLVKLLSGILKRSSAEVLPEILICSTIRNPETYSGFKQQLGKRLQRDFVLLDIRVTLMSLIVRHLHKKIII